METNANNLLLQTLAAGFAALLGAGWQNSTPPSSPSSPANPFFGVNPPATAPMPASQPAPADRTIDVNPPAQLPMQASGSFAAGWNAPAAYPTGVVINAVAVPPEQIQMYLSSSGGYVPPGDYWYDAKCGAFGLKGGPTQGFITAGLPLGGALRADASGGGNGALTGVFVNGRELHPIDVQGLSRMGRVMPGRYWLDASANFGVEGSSMALGNLMPRGAGSGPTGPGYNKTNYGGHLGSDGETSFYFDPSSGASVIPGEGVSY